MARNAKTVRSPTPIYNYERTLKAEANEFAAMAFHRVFVNRDAAIWPNTRAGHASFLLRRLSSIESGPSWAR